MRGPRTKVKGSKVPVTKFPVLTCWENGRGVVILPAVGQAIHVPAPRTAKPVQVQDVTVIVPVPKDRPVKVDEAVVPVDGSLPTLGNEMLALQHREEHVGVQTDATVFLETPQLLLTVDAGLAVLDHRDVLYLGEVQLGECDGTSVRLFRDDAPALANELGGIETTTVDDDLRLINGLIHLTD